MLLIQTKNLGTGQGRAVLSLINLQVQQPRSSFPQPVDQQICFEYVHPEEKENIYAGDI